MRVSGSYDLIVIGDQLAGFFLAASAAQAGFKVLVIEGTTVSTAVYERPSGRFLTDLVCEPLLGLSAGSKEDQFLKSLGLYQEINELFPSFSPELQILTQKRRIDYNYPAESLEKEFARELGGRPEKLIRALAGKTVSKKSFAEVLQDARLPVEWEKFGALQLALYGSAAPTVIPYAAYKQVVDLAASGGVRYALGGRSSLKERLLGRLQVYGGGIKRNAWVEAIIFEYERLSGVLLSTYEGFVSSPIVVGSMGASTFLRLVPEELQPNRLADSVSKITPKYWRMNFTVILPEHTIPEGLGEHFAYLETDSPLEEDAFFQAQLLPKEVYSGIPLGHRALLVRFLVPFTAESLTVQYLQRMMNRVLMKVEKYIPHLRERMVSITPNPQDLAQDPVYQKYFHFPSIAHIPPAFLVYENTLDRNLTSHEFMDWSNFNLDGLALCSRDMNPLLGLMGEIRTAMDLLGILVARREKQRAKKS